MVSGKSKVVEDEDNKWMKKSNEGKVLKVFSANTWVKENYEN